MLAPNENQQATLVIQREVAGRRDSARSFVVVVDGKKMGKLRSGDEIVLQVTPGKHRVQGRIDWAGSPKVEVDLTAGQRAVMRLRSASSALRLDQTIYQMVCFNRYLKLEQVE